MVRTTLLMACVFAVPIDAATSGDVIPPDAARAVFAEGAALCAADGGELWGVSLCGPLLLVDPSTRTVVASQNDATGTLHDAGGVYTGALSQEAVVANASLEWSGVRWAALSWPLPEDPASRATLLMRGSFDRDRPKLPLPAARAADNAHLDTLDGRYLLQLEWRALAQALGAASERAARASAEDALRFRNERRQLYPGAAEAESARELDAGLAQYTGVMLGNATSGARTAAAVEALARHEQDASFVESFADASGPAYGLLLDRFAAGWRSRLASGEEPDALLIAALRIDRTAESASQLGRRAARYGGDALLKSEIARDARRRAAAKAQNPR
jgi:hypothetical protein